MHVRLNLSETALAFNLAERAASSPCVFIARSDTRLDRLARFCAGFCAGRVELLALPPWDVLPYDRTAPSAAVVGRRVHALARLASGGARPGVLLLTSADAAMQRVPPPGTWKDVELALKRGDELCPEAFAAALRERGFHGGETVSEPGEAALRGHVVDVFPPGADDPVRLELDGGRIAQIHRFDPVTQRSIKAIDHVLLTPAVEFPLDPADAEGALDSDETPVALPSGRLVPLFDYLRGFTILSDDSLQERWEALREQAQDAWQGSRHAARTGAGGVLPRPDRLFLSVRDMCSLTESGSVPVSDAVEVPVPRRVPELIERARGSEVPVVIAGGGAAGKLAASLTRRGLPVRHAADWPDAVSGGVACLDLHIDAGFSTGTVLVLPAEQLMRQAGHGSHGLGERDAAPRVGDVVVHADHGAARLAGLAAVDADGYAEERLLLRFNGDKELLCHPSELDRIWRYGSEGALDRLDGAAWQARKAEMEAEIAGVADRLAAEADARARRQAPAMDPDPAGYERLARRFPYALSPDQADAVDAVLADLRRGSPPTDRLVCGDVGFGKTEVALRAAACVALSGWQVAVIAPTTVLARQHLDTFRRRFAGTEVRVEGLLAAASPRNRAVREGIADGSVQVVVGTQGLGASSLGWHRLGLVVVDEEQRLGEELKQSLSGTHRLLMTATPIPRTMQAAMVGLQEVSVIATAPVLRQPTRTVVAEFDDVLVRDALVREHGRGGQSFVVCPRIADLSAMADRLAALAPGLRVTVAHGRMKAEELEDAVVGFAGGAGDVLLATDIIEAGLDIPRANTIVITQPDRFGLAQLHQMRGRVGRGGRRGTAFLLTEPGRKLAAATRARLHALAVQSHLGAGVAISAADLDQRGAGELFGDKQAGHVSALGTELYQDLLLRALDARRGKKPPAPVPELNVGLTGCIPAEMVPEADLRISLYRRVARMRDAATVDDFAEEMHDRFGATPDELRHLLALVRLRCQCVAAGVARLDAGPRGAAFRLHDPAGLDALARRVGGAVKEERVVVAAEGNTASARVAALAGLLG